MNGKKGLPPVKVRLSKFINENLGQNPIVGGYTEIPVYTFMERGPEDDLNFHNCKYLDQSKNYYFNLPSTFK